MLYAKIVLGLKVEGPFDYFVPGHLEEKIKPGSRALVSFGFRKKVVGFVAGISSKTVIRNLKPVLDVLDDVPLLSRKMLELAGELAAYYCCSPGEVIETALPEELRRPRRIALRPVQGAAEFSREPGPARLIHDISGIQRWEIYRKEVHSVLNNGGSVILLLPDVPAVVRAKEMFTGYFPPDVIEVLYRKQPRELEIWQRIKEGRARIVIGTRSAVFAPLQNTGLIIIDEEQDFVYKQDQVPHYHAREAAFMRCRLEKAGFILGSRSPSLESYYLVKQGAARYEFLSRKDSFPEIKISDMRNMPLFELRKKSVFSRYLLDCIVATLKASGKTLLFLNRKGFATAAFCAVCGHVLKCGRCNSNLVYHYQTKELHCPYCTFAMPAPKLCPSCNSGYIKFSGIGTEKIESELARLVPQARIKRPTEHEALDVKGSDIVVASEGSIRSAEINFDLIGVLSIDSSLNRIDFRAGEKTFGLLSELWRMTDKKIVIQTLLPHHYCFTALQAKNTDVFYEEELKQRKQLRLPPFCHIAHLKLRGAKEEKVKEVSQALFESLLKNKKAGVRVISVNPGQPSKLRGNYYRQILLGASSAVKIGRFLKPRLKSFKHSGIIVTVDVDPL
ncbi:MAG: primosomal protein N' [Candidatus Omnitrophica bacterium]|nr:primosomal protein N' [Candidatus Omnitrophota bacterium]